MVALGVPIMKNFVGYAKLMQSVDYNVLPLVHNNWDMNWGVAYGWNRLIDEAIAEHEELLIICNDDVTFEYGTIDKLVKVMTTGPEIDFLSAANHDHDKLEIVYATKPDFSCFMIRPKRFVEKFGYFDEKFEPAYFEDDDMYYRMRVLGGVSGLLQTARIYHEGSVTQFWDGEEEGRVVSHEQFVKNRERYKAKWGGIYGTESYNVPFNGMTGKTAKEW
jgi:GT2 family glycosyltransferase